MFFDKKEEKRADPRFEPYSVNASFKTASQAQFCGYLLDVSRGGLAIDLPHTADLPDVGSKVDISVMSKTTFKNWIGLGHAKVLRTWTESAYYDNGKGIALALDDHIIDSNKDRLLLRGIQQQIRLIKQDRLAAHDINHLSSYRRSLAECQVNIFTTTITLSVSLAAAYFALNYYGIATNKLSDPAMSFWRTLVAALPGIIAIVFGLIVSQKNASIQRVDAYLAVLKECLVNNRYPREYKGWETESHKFRHVFRTKACDDCDLERKCGTLKENEQQAIDSRKLLINPYIDLYYIIMYSTFYAIMIISTLAVFIELQKFQWGFNIYMATNAAITVIMLLAIAGIFKLTVQLRKGKLSFDHYRRCWIDILSRCRKRLYV